MQTRSAFVLAGVATFAGLTLTLATPSAAAPHRSTAPKPTVAAPTVAPSTSARPVPPSRPSAVPTAGPSGVITLPSRTAAPVPPVISVPAGGSSVPSDEIPTLAIVLIASGVALAGGGVVLAARRR